MNAPEQLGIFPDSQSGQISLMRYSKTSCGVDFMLNTATNREKPMWFERGKSYKTDFFEFFFFHKASGYVLLRDKRVELHDGMLLIISPDQQQEWHADIDQMVYTFLVFKEDFVSNFLSDRYFMYRLVYCYQSDRPTWLSMSADDMAPLLSLLTAMRTELVAPVNDSYHMIVAYLYQFLLKLNRIYAHVMGIPVMLPLNNYAFQFKQLLEEHVCVKSRVEDYAEMIGVSRICLNKAVKDQFGVTTKHLIKRRLLQEIKNNILFDHLSIKETAHRLNFSEDNHMMRFFKQQTGQTISEFIADYQAKQKV